MLLPKTREDGSFQRIARQCICADAPPSYWQNGGRTNLSRYEKWKKQMNANLIAVMTPQTWGRGKGHLGLLHDPVVFHERNGAA